MPKELSDEEIEQRLAAGVKVLEDAAKAGRIRSCAAQPRAPKPRAPGSKRAFSHKPPLAQVRKRR
jgi:hypothetical protein